MTELAICISLAHLHRCPGAGVVSQLSGHWKAGKKSSLLRTQHGLVGHPVWRWERIVWPSKGFPGWVSSTQRFYALGLGRASIVKQVFSVCLALVSSILNTK